MIAVRFAYVLAKTVLHFREACSQKQLLLIASNSQWLVDHESLIKAALLFAQAQKVLLIFIWFTEHVRYWANLSVNGTDCMGVSHPNHQFGQPHLFTFIVAL